MTVSKSTSRGVELEPGWVAGRSTGVEATDVCARRRDDRATTSRGRAAVEANDAMRARAAVVWKRFRLGGKCACFSAASCDRVRGVRRSSNVVRSARRSRCRRAHGRERCSFMLATCLHRFRASACLPTPQGTVTSEKARISVLRARHQSSFRQGQPWGVHPTSAPSRSGAVGE
jgi:hypothetical protein